LKSTTLIALAAVTLVGMVSGCSDKNPGNATAQSPTGSSPETTSSKPAFSQPELDPTKFSDRPCDLLTSAQLAELGKFKAPESEKAAAGSMCHWRAQDTLKGTRYDVTIYADGNTIESIASSVKGSPVVKDAKVSGYPAVSYDITDGKGTCSTAVGTSAKHAILVQMIAKDESLPEWKDSCGASEKAAALVLENLKG
jgi:hypothetical protein